MYASVTEYSKLYDDSYRDGDGARTSFDISLFSQLLAAFCRDVGVNALLDVSGGQGRLGEVLAELGIHTLTTDITAAPGSSVTAFDLSRYSDSDVARIRQMTGRAFGATTYVTTCLNVLDHIDREHVFAALRNLAGLSVRYLVLSISTRPSTRDNLFRASMLPLSTWIRVLAVAGFRLLPQSPAVPAAHRLIPNQADPLANHWQLIDPFGDADAPDPRYLFLEKFADAPDWTAAETEMEALLDIAYRRTKRRQFSFPKDTRFALSLHHVREYSFLRALLDVLPRDAVRVMLRAPILADNQRRAITGLLARTGVQTDLYERAEELPWSELTGRILITAAESGCAINHVLGLQISALARLHGCRTYLLQHGIWPRNFPGRIVTFNSEHVLNWGAAEERILSLNQHRLGAVDAPWGMFSPGQVRSIGSPRYTDQLLPAHPDGLDLRLGVRRDQFASTILLATKKLGARWGRPEADDGLLAAMLRLIESCPESLFILRPHPAQSAESLLALRRENVRILDETCCIAADIPLGRIIPFVDGVITPISTVALDGAISGKSVIVCEVGQPRMYDHLEAVSAERLPDLLRSPEFLAGAAHRARLFRDAYAEAVDTRFYERFAALLAEPAEVSRAPDAALATTVSLAAEAEHQWFEAGKARAAAAKRIGELGAGGASKKAAELTMEVDRLRKELATARHDLRKLRQSVSWRMTAPLRRAQAAIGRLRRRHLDH